MKPSYTLALFPVLLAHVAPLLAAYAAQLKIEEPVLQVIAWTFSVSPFSVSLNSASDSFCPASHSLHLSPKPGSYACVCVCMHVRVCARAQLREDL